MRLPIAVAAFVLSAAVPALAGSTAPSITGDYVEARTAHVFAGGCIMSSEAETIGKQAVLAWRVSRGSFNGVALDGLAVMAAVSGDRNLGIREIGGSAPSRVRAAIIVDERATPVQREALVAFVQAASGRLIDDVVEISASPIAFETTAHAVRVSGAAATLAVQRHIHHDPGCGAMQWFHPFATGADATVGFTDAHSFSGAALGTRWSHPNKRSGFVGTFAF
jgi:hypothetical protein